MTRTAVFSRHPPPDRLEEVLPAVSAPVGVPPRTTPSVRPWVEAHHSACTELTLGRIPYGNGKGPFVRAGYDWSSMHCTRFESIDTFMSSMFHDYGYMCTHACRCIDF